VNANTETPILPLYAALRSRTDFECLRSICLCPSVLSVSPSGGEFRRRKVSGV
jgi:hypothetical protein